MIGIWISLIVLGAFVLGVVVRRIATRHRHRWIPVGVSYVPPNREILESRQDRGIFDEFTEAAMRGLSTVTSRCDCGAVDAITHEGRVLIPGIETVVDG